MKKVMPIVFVIAVLILAFNLFPAAAFGQTTCSKAVVKGKYGFVGTGLVPEQLPNHGGVRWDPISQVAVVNFDGSGKVSLTTRFQYHGQLNPKSGDGTYDVKSDCTGGAVFKDDSDAVVFTWNFVLVRSGDEIETIEVMAASGARPMYSMTFSQHKI